MEVTVEVMVVVAGMVAAAPVEMAVAMEVMVDPHTEPFSPTAARHTATASPATSSNRIPTDMANSRASRRTDIANHHTVTANLRTDTASHHTGPAATIITTTISKVMDISSHLMDTVSRATEINSNLMDPLHTDHPTDIASHHTSNSRMATVSLPISSRRRRTDTANPATDTSNSNNHRTGTASRATDIITSSPTVQPQSPRMFRSASAPATDKAMVMVVVRRTVRPTEEVTASHNSRLSKLQATVARVIQVTPTTKK